MTSSDLLVVAGEASGDLHGARLLAALGRRLPGIRAFGLGSDQLAAAGLERIADSREISVVGLVEVLSILTRAREIFHQLLAETERRRPRAAVLIDFPDFNLRLARELAWRGVPVVYYVSPQIWAWRRGRVRTIADAVARMLVLFKFEEDFYRAHRVPAVHVGHPLVDEVPEDLPQAWSAEPAGRPVDRFRVALLPGSRKSELAALLPAMAGAVARLGARLPIDVRLIRAPSLDPELVERAAAEANLSAEIVAEDRLRAVADSHLALCASGTATLETGLLGTPMIVLYRLAPISYLLARLLVRVPHFSLVNLVLERGAVPELLQKEASPERIAGLAERLLTDRRAIARMRSELADLRGRLGAAGASERAAAEVAAVLEGGAGR
jgi:lipid-A-disaccharide synthase